VVFLRKTRKTRTIIKSQNWSNEPSLRTSAGGPSIATGYQQGGELVGFADWSTRKKHETFCLISPRKKSAAVCAWKIAQRAMAVKALVWADAPCFRGGTDSDQWRLGRDGSKFWP
jgi:hypothetical protein